MPKGNSCGHSEMFSFGKDTYFRVKHIMCMRERERERENGNEFNIRNEDASSVSSFFDISVPKQLASF